MSDPLKAPSGEAVELALAAFNAWYEEHIDPEHYDFREGIEAALLADEREAREKAERAELENFGKFRGTLMRAERAEAALLEARQTLVAIERHQYFIDKTFPAEVKALVRGGREPLQRMARAALGSLEEADR